MNYYVIHLKLTLYINYTSIKINFKKKDRYLIEKRALIDVHTPGLGFLISKMGIISTLILATIAVVTMDNAFNIS